VPSLDPAGVAAFFAAVCAVCALSLNSAEHWGWRRIAIGGGSCAAAIVALLRWPSALWWGAILWGIHQTYVGWSFISRRRHFGRERLEYLQSSASVLAYIALADSDIKPRERRIIRETYHRAGFSGNDLLEVDRILDECARYYFSDGSSLERLYVRLHTACETLQRHSTPHTRLALFRTALLIAASDGFVTSGERAVLRATAPWLGISPDDEIRAWEHLDGRGHDASDSASERAEHSRPRQPIAPPDLATYYASVLGVTVTASPQELKRAYREKAKQYHPDVVMHQGTTSARDAEERFKELSAAYDFFRGTVTT
jgi:DnaJ-domain-containing protein 1